MRFVVLLVALVAALAFSPAARADAWTVELAAADDVTLPFGCLWGYDFDTWCHPVGGPRLLVGSVDDKIWRALLRFDVASLARAPVDYAVLWLWFDGTCLNSRGLVDDCPARSWELYAQAVIDPARLRPRDPVPGAAEAFADLELGDGPQWVAFDVTSLVRRWHAGDGNHGLLVRAGEADESSSEGGPRFAATEEALPSLRPRLEVSVVPG